MNKEFKEQWCNFIIYLENELLGRRLVKYEYDLIEYSFKEGFKEQQNNKIYNKNLK